MKKYLIPMIVLAVCGCSKTHDPEKTPEKIAENAPIPGAIPEAETQAPVKESVVSAGEKGWVVVAREGGEARKCFDINGCMDGEIRVMAGVEKRENGILTCGNASDQGVNFVAGYRCSPNRGMARCTLEQCPCGETSINYGEFCVGSVENGAFDKTSKKYVKPDEVDAAGVEPAAPKTDRKPVRTCGENEGEVIDDGNFAEFKCLTHDWEGTSGFEQGYLVCMNPKGCKTKDGRIYSAYGYFTDNAYMSETYGSCAYYVRGDKDTSGETLCIHGTCVVPEDVELTTKTVKIVQHGRLLPPGFAVIGQTDRPDEDELDMVHQSDYFVKPDESFYEDRKPRNLIEGPVVDTIACEGGVKYCHGKDNPSMAAPANPEGYLCKKTDFMPGRELKFDKDYRAWICDKEWCECGGQKCSRQSACIDEKCYCGNQSTDPSQDYACTDIHRREENRLEIRMTCNGTNCPCGTQNCVPGTHCADGQCICGDIVVPSRDNWECTTSIDVGTLRCKNPNGCVVNGKTYLENAIYHKDGRMMCDDHTATIPGDNYACQRISEYKYGWVCVGNAPCPCYGTTVKPGEACDYRRVLGRSCEKPNVLTPDGCLCDGKPALEDYQCMTRKDGSTVNVCFHQNECSCGTTVCKRGVFCRDGKCIEPPLVQDWPSLDYWRSKIADDAERAVVCAEKEGCFCGAGKCRYDEACLDGQCYPARLSFVRDGHRFSFNYDDYQVHQAAYNMLRDPRWITCNPDETDEEETVIDYANSDRIDDYYCDIVEVSCPDDDEICDLSFEEKYKPDGLVCNGEYCMCGGLRCPKDAPCNCKLDDANRIQCACDSPDVVREFPDKTLGCADSRVPVKHAPAYACVGDLGFVCQNETCPCGSATCAKGAVCMASGKCTGVTERFK